MIYIYIAVSESRKLIKIGRTSDYNQRRTMLQGELKAPDLVYAVLIESDEFSMNHDEWQLHAKFAPYFANGTTREQFVLNPHTEAVILAIKLLSFTTKDGLVISSADKTAKLWPAADGDKQQIGKPMKPPKGERFSRKPKQTGFHTLRIKLPDSLHARLKVYAAQNCTSMQAVAESCIEYALVDRASQINPALASANPQKRGM